MLLIKGKAGTHTEGSAFFGQVGEGDFEVDAVAMSSAGGLDRSFDVTVKRSCFEEGVLWQRSDGRLSPWIVLHSDCVSQLL